ncbi:hypothetical protein FFLO_02544 [Filobasidium floriforme]|uniref:Transcriptional repressor Tup1 N-terminal domain-containing protein n=1 Tax=Filobasidium floriforme TaxID=5210 RepID=A0A8K0JMD6_9TREE|nr:WD40-repeat-containing domain protein [Filobasidium floriforme]KAG7561989.1 hypothetical protein FFLO_02544 [Filobasidium floriforme]KAH8086937.1 WD40-repeat-containing domain protein [Filobasidium floriforme]
MALPPGPGARIVDGPPGSNPGGVPPPGAVLIPSGGPGGPSVAGHHPHQVQSAHHQIHDNGAHDKMASLLNEVRSEYEAMQTDCMVLKGQRDEYENKINQQIQEIALIRQGLYELEAQHAKIRGEYDAEINRLRRELDHVRAGPAGNGAPPPVPASATSASGVGTLPSFLPAPPGGPLPPNPADRERELERERQRERDREREREHRLPPPTASGAAATSVGRPTPTPAPKSPPLMLSELDPDTLPRDFKKEGQGWSVVWNPKTKKQLEIAPIHTLVHESVVCCVKFSNDGLLLATGCNRTAQIFDTKTGAKTHILSDETASQAGDLYIRSITFSPDCKYLATGAEDRQIRIWDIKTKRIRHLLQGHQQEIYSLEFSRDGGFIVSGSGDKSARIWDMATGSCVFDLRIDDVVQGEVGPIDAGITSVALSPDSRLVAAGSLDTVVRVWSTVTGQQIERLRGHKDSVYSVAFSPDGNSLVSGSLDRTLRVWDLSGTKRAVSQNLKGGQIVNSSGTCAHTLNGHKDYVLSVGVTPDGQWVVSGSKDRSIQFWNVASEQAHLMLQGHKNSVISIDLAKSGNMLASGSGDCHARIWSYNTPA